MFKSAAGIIYLIIGFLVANSHGYLVLDTISNVLSLILAVFLWPLILFGVDLHIAL